MDSDPAKKLKVRPPDGFREAIPDSGYASLEEFRGDYLQDEPDASPESDSESIQVRRTEASEEGSAELVCVRGRLKFKWFGTTGLFIPLDVNQTGTIDFVFAYSRRTGLLLHRAESAANAYADVPHKSMKPTTVWSSARCDRVGHSRPSAAHAVPRVLSSSSSRQRGAAVPDTRRGRESEHDDDDTSRFTPWDN